MMKMGSTGFRLDQGTESDLDLLNVIQFVVYYIWIGKRPMFQSLLGDYIRRCGKNDDDVVGLLLVVEWSVGGLLLGPSSDEKMNYSS